MPTNLLRWASLLGAAAIALGAFGAHGLKELLPEPSLNSFETGVRYHMYHALALLATLCLYHFRPDLWFLRACRLFIIGIFLFSGSLYLITLLKLGDAIGVSGLGLVTPLGGVFFIAGWLCIWKGATAKKG